jgi:septum formation protein
MTPARPLILASTSPTRRRLLHNAGIAFTTAAPSVDEALLRQSLAGEGASLEDAVVALAEAKALSVGRSAGNSDALVLGADSIAAIEDEDGAETWLEKAENRAAARRVLDRLNGRSHRLASGAVVVCGDSVLWRHVAVTRLTMRSCTPTFLDAYLERLGGAAMTTVGCYYLEEEGAQLFVRVDGDQFTVLGLPLLPVLGFLREHSVIET